MKMVKKHKISTTNCQINPNFVLKTKRKGKGRGKEEKNHSSRRKSTVKEQETEKEAKN